MTTPAVYDNSVRIGYARVFTRTLHRPDGAIIADNMLFMVAAMAAEMERDLIRERTLNGLRAGQRYPTKFLARCSDPR
jgi:hypothetical protein